MERLSGVDATFLALETDTMHMHVGAVMVVDPSASEMGDDVATRYFDRLRAVIEERIHLVPLLRRRVVRVPFGLHHPVWVEDPHFDLDHHLYRASLPAPGGPAELAAFVAALASRPLDPNSPLWEMHVVEGLESGHVAVVPKVHHALFDGASGVEVVASFLDTGPVARAVSSPARPWRPEPIPTDAELIGSAMSSLVRQPERAAGVLRRTFGAVRDLSERNRRLREEDDLTPPPAPFRAPRTSLNGAISTHRRFSFTEVPLEEIRTVRRVFGGTVNDVVLAAVAGAVRRLLAERGERLEEPVVAMVPMSRRAESDRSTLGNKVSAMLVSLATQIADPVQRYTTIAAGTRLAKDQARVVSEELDPGMGTDGVSGAFVTDRSFGGEPASLRSPAAALQRPGLEHRGLGRRAVVRGGSTGGALPHGPHHRGGRPERDGGELPEHPLRRDTRVSRARAGDRSLR